MWGYASGDTATVREDLPPRVRNFVKEHELYHLTDKWKWGGALGREIRANVVPAIKDPIGAIAGIIESLKDPDRIKFYWDRIKNRY